MSDIVLMGDPQVAAIPVDEVGEPLTSVGDLPLSLHKEELGDGRLLLRASVAERLGEAARQLPAGYQLLFVEGWRAPDVQRGYFEQYKETLRQDGLAADEDELYRLASRYVSPPQIAPHTSGAAVDLT
jgi:zinc D-Ala-D-Ala dipeptidase